MNAPLIWIVLPAAAGMVFFALRRWMFAIYISGILLALFLGWISWQLPIDEPISLRLWARFPSIEIESMLSIFGRQFVLNNASKSMRMMIFVGLAFWIGGSYPSRAGRLFIPLSYATTALMMASFAVEINLYAILIIQIMAMVSVPILSPPGNQGGQGVLRFLIFQTLGICFILLADWSLPLAGIDLSGTDVYPPAIILTGLGFALILALFPFHTWIPMLGGSSNPYSAVFVFYSISTTAILLLLEYINRYAILGIIPVMETSLQAAGVLMVLIGGIWAVFDRNLARIMGFAMILQIGMSLLALSLGVNGDADGAFMGIFFVRLVPLVIALALWALAAAIIQKKANSLQFRHVQGLAHTLPFAGISLIAANFSIVGIPLFAGFPVNLWLWSSLINVSPGGALLSLAGHGFLLVAGLRMMAVLVEKSDQVGWRTAENRIQRTLLILGVIMIFVVGLMPDLLLSPLTNIGLMYTSPVP